MDKKVIGIDIGHCETSMAMPTRIAEEGGKYRVERLKSYNEEKVVWTQVALTNAQMEKLAGKLRPTWQELSALGPFRIGHLIPADVDGELFSYFKVPPKEFDDPCGRSGAARKFGITHGQVMACFAFALVNSLFEVNVDLQGASREDFMLMIGCPAMEDWTDPEAQEAYAELISRAANISEVRIVPESRAAMFSSLENGRRMVSAVKGAAIFDFGSSTADCTYMLLGRKRIELSWELGACEIERNMARTAYQQAEEMFGAFIPDSVEYAKLERNLRDGKEAYYLGYAGANWKLHLASFVNSENGEEIVKTVRVGDELMRQAVEERKMQVVRGSAGLLTGSWKDLCRAFLAEAKQKIQEATYTVSGEDGVGEIRSCELDTVVLTGGASQMGFVEDLCKEVFPGITVIKEKTPSQTVSNGLAWAAVSDSNFTSCYEAAGNEIKGKPECSAAGLIDAVSDAAFAEISRIVKAEARSWANESGDQLTARDLTNRISRNIGRPETQKSLVEACDRIIRARKQTISDALAASVNRQVELLYADSVARALVIPEDVWKSLQAEMISFENLDIPAVLKDIDMSGVAAGIGKIIAHIIIWAIAIVLAPETFGLSILGGLIASAVAEDALSDKDLDKPRKQSIRKKVADKIDTSLGETKYALMEPFKDSLNKQMEGFDESLSRTLKTAFEIVTLKRFEI